MTGPFAWDDLTPALRRVELTRLDSDERLAFEPDSERPRDGSGIRPEAVDALGSAVLREYPARTGLTPMVLRVVATEGAGPGG